MSEVLIGSAYATAILRYEQFTQGVSAVEQQIKRLQALTKTPIVASAQLGGAGAGSGSAAGGQSAAPISRAPSIDRDAAAYTRLVREQATLEAQQARLARGQGDGARAAQLEAQAIERLTSELQAQVGVTTQSIAIERQLTTVQQQVTNAAKQSQGSFGTQAIDQFKAGLLGIVGPAAVVATGFTAARAAVQSFEEAFKFKAELDQNTASITAQLRGVRDSSQAFADARVFADRYKLTQEDTTTAIQASVPLLRQSKSSLTDVLTVLSKLQVLKPEQGIQGAAFALAELEGGQSRSLATRFNIPIAKATEMKNEIQAGGDAVQILGQYLDKAGIGAEALEVRTKGAAGAMNDAKIAAEQLKIAQADFAQGPGIAILNEQTRLTTGLTRVLGGGGGLTTAFQAIAEANRNADIYQLVYNQSLENGATDAQAAAAATNAVAQSTQAAAEASSRLTDIEDIRTRQTRGATDATLSSVNALSEESLKKLDDQIASAQLSQQQKQLEADSYAAANGLLGAGDQALILAKKYGIATEQAKFLILQQQALSNATALADQRKGEQTGTTLTANEFNKFDKLSRQGAIEAAAEKKKADDKAAADAAQLQDSRDALALSRAKTSAQKIAIYQQELARATTEVERNRILAQIEGAKTGGVGRVSAAKSTALQLNNVEENSGLQLLKTQRENLERLRDQAEDFEVRRTRAQEDFAEKRRKLLSGGQRKQAELATQEFEKQQKRDQEDFDRQRRRTLRNNQEGVGDIGARADLRQQQIGDRAALRGVRTAGGVDLGAAAPTLTGAGVTAMQPRVIILRSQIAPTSIQIDGHTIVDITWPEIEQRVDTELANAINGTTTPGSGQTAVAGL